MEQENHQAGEGRQPHIHCRPCRQSAQRNLTDLALALTILPWDPQRLLITAGGH
jgi:hypothetical protein